ncbi:aspartic peptidase domain-containing protein [Podospora didyma]|uniref:Aspartic peptidase domain-containing protein n=1 Tax=Podospora didyma TaxID=330526 RepID=A0AAE0U5A7_9PEZI|nr:aspartic peptidase domain-containing protein [Podospora didyma]
MRLPYLVATVVCDILLWSVPGVVAEPVSPVPEALWIQPSGDWGGIDGNWSNFLFAVGAPAQIVYLTVATALSELWVVETGGCSPVQLCIDARGGVFDIPSSETWRSLGNWQLGMNYTGMEGNGDYGLETLAFVNTVTSIATAVDGALVAAINTTDYYQGFIGVGVTQGRFGTNLTNPLISQLAETYGTIASHSYGYTAGAYYRDSPGSKGTGVVASLTLGGYDTMRFVPHETKFALDAVTRQPTVLLRGVTAQVKSLDKAPSNWTSTSRTLLSMSDSVRAIIDTSTPYLWLPTEVCERFASALNLTWREDLGVYVFTDKSQYTRYQTDTDLSFVFSVSSYDNMDDFGSPLDVHDVVNITFPAAAFAQTLRYPFKNVIKWGNTSIPYFPLKRSTKEVNNNQYIIGRAFMQEAYLIANYEKGKFSLHQAAFPPKAATNYALKGIERPPDSPYPAYSPPGSGGGGGGLNKGQTVGIVLSAFAIGSVLGLILWLCCRRRKKNAKKGEQAEENKSETQSVDCEPTSPVKRMFSIITGRKRSKKAKKLDVPEVPDVHEVHGSSTQPAEVGADAQHQLFELPVPPEPVELDSNDIGDTDTELGVDSAQDLSEYELTRRKLERQLHGPAPTYSMIEDHGKSIQDISCVAHYRSADEPSPVSSPTYANTNSLPDSLPSPLTVHPDWATRMFDLPSPMTIPPTFYSHQLPPNGSSSGSEPGCSYSPVSPRSPNSPQTFAPSSVTRSNSSNISPASAIGSMRLPSPTFQRAPIDPTRVVCLGPLPEGVQLPHQRPMPQIVTPSRRRTDAGPSPIRPSGSLPTGILKRSRSTTRGSNETLGSNFTVEEENRLHEEHVPEEEQQSTRESADDNIFPRSPRSMERIEGGSELVHVPQVADKRYSWEPDPDRR